MNASQDSHASCTPKFIALWLASSPAYLRIMILRGTCLFAIISLPSSHSGRTFKFNTIKALLSVLQLYRHGFVLNAWLRTVQEYKARIAPHPIRQNVDLRGRTCGYLSSSKKVLVASCTLYVIT